MGNPRKRTFRHPDDRRRDLMDAAVGVFRDKGMGQATVADIATAAGVAKGTFYLSFATKEELIGALKQRFAEEMVDRTQAHLARIGNDDLWVVADAMVESIIDFYFEQRSLAHVLAREGVDPHASPGFAEAGKKIETMIATGIRIGVDAGTFSCSDPEITAGLLSHAIEGFLRHAFLYEAVERDRLVAAAKEFVHKVLAN